MKYNDLVELTWEIQKSVNNKHEVLRSKIKKQIPFKKYLSGFSQQVLIKDIVDDACGRCYADNRLHNRYQKMIAKLVRKEFPEGTRILKRLDELKEKNRILAYTKDKDDSVAKEMVELLKLVKKWG